MQNSDDIPTMLQQRWMGLQFLGSFKRFDLVGGSDRVLKGGSEKG